MILVVFGLPGAGKTTLAKAVAQRLGWKHLNTDIIRNEFIKEKTYSDEEKQKVYDLLFEQAGKYAEKGVVLDGTFYMKELREKIKDKGEVFFIKCTAPEEIVRKRMEERGLSTQSDADFLVYLKIKEVFEEGEGEEVDTTLPLEEQVKKVLETVRKGKN